MIIAAMVIITADLILLDYRTLAWSKNLGAYLGIIAMILVIVNMIIQIRRDKKLQSNLTDESQ